MIHVATVHWRSERWIDLQLRYLDRFLDGEYRSYAFLNDVPGDHASKFFFSSTEEITSHETKLNLLADMILLSAGDPDDLMLFIDGDAFPIRPVHPLVRARLDRHRVIAVQRYENNGDVQPHPCFCITTVGFWKELGGDWHRGHEWLDLQGSPVTDVGGNLLALLEGAGVDWYPLRRMNTKNPHPLFFAVYGDDDHGGVVYHHGAGFRKAPGGRVSRVQHGERATRSRLTARIMNQLPKRGPLGAVRARYHPVARLHRTLMEETAQLSEDITRRIERDDEFWREFV